MQKLSTPQNKTPAKKRLSKNKSFAGSPLGGQNGIAKSPTKEKNENAPFTPTPKKQAGVKTPQPNKTPKQKTPQKTPNVVRKTPNVQKNPNAVQNQNKANGTGGKLKRKQSLVSSGDEGTSPKQQKLATLAGTKKLNGSSDNKKKTPQAKNVNPQQGSPNTAVDKKALKNERTIQKRKERKNQVKHAFQELREGRPVSPTFVNSIINGIQILQSRENLTNSATRKLLRYKRIQKLINQVHGVSTLVKANNSQQKKTKAPPAKQGKKLQKKPVLNETEEEADDSDYDTEDSVEDEEVASDVNETDSGEESIEEENDNESENENEDEDEDEGAEEEDDADQKNKIAANGNSKVGKSRYVLFVGNLPHEATENDIKKHFVKVGKITNVRIPFKINNGEKSPKGFAYVEFADKETYEKALSLHHSFLKGRRINVEYTTSNKNKDNNKVKREIKAKNFKLHAMKNKGMLAGSVKQNQKRSVRRAKNKTV